MLGKGVDILLSVSVLFILFLVNEHQLRPSKNRREQKETKEEDTPTGQRIKAKKTNRKTNTNIKYNLSSGFSVLCFLFPLSLAFFFLSIFH